MSFNETRGIWLVLGRSLVMKLNTEPLWQLLCVIKIMNCFCMNIGMHFVCNQCAMTTPADLTLCVILYGRMSLRGSSCCYCVSCTLTFSNNLLAALPHFITQQYGLSLIITYWFFIIINAVRVVYKASFEWAAEAQLHGTSAPCLWFEQGQRNQSPLIGDLQRETWIVHRRSRQSPQSGDFPLTCVHAASVHSLKTTR